MTKSSDFPENGISEDTNKISFFICAPIFTFVIYCLLSLLNAPEILIYFGSVLAGTKLTIFLLGFFKLAKLNFSVALNDPFWGNFLSGCIAIYLSGLLFTKDCKNIELMQNQEAALVILVALIMTGLSKLIQKFTKKK